MNKTVQDKTDVKKISPTFQIVFCKLGFSTVLIVCGPRKIENKVCGYGILTRKPCAYRQWRQMRRENLIEQKLFSGN